MSTHGSASGAAVADPGVFTSLMHRALDGTVHYRQGVPVMPGAVPWLGHFPWMVYHSAEVLKEARRRLGPLFYLHMGPNIGEILVCTGPDAFEIMRQRSAYIAATSGSSTEQFIGRHGLLLLRGDEHHRMRAAMNPPFVPRGLSLSGIGQVMAECITARLADLPLGRPLPILAATQRLALELIFRLINVAPGELDAWQQNYRHFMEILIPVPWDLPGLPRRRALTAKRWLVARMEEIITKERQLPPSSSLVSVLAHARDEAGVPLSLDELCENLRLLILAGHETTASVLAWMVVELARDPALWRDLCAEAERVGSIPQTPQAARECPLAEALFREALRLYPPVFMTARTLGEAVTLYGMQLPAGQRLMVALGDIARDERVFPDPERFNPRRWFTPRIAKPTDKTVDKSADKPADKSADKSADPSTDPSASTSSAKTAPLRTMAPPTPIETSQFGGGPHFCLGYHLAVFEATQFAVGLALHLGRRGRRPQLHGKPPHAVYSPLNHPSAGTLIEFV